MNSTVKVKPELAGEYCEEFPICSLNKEIFEIYCRICGNKVADRIQEACNENWNKIRKCKQ